jgi:hypothetical protein
MDQLTSGSAAFPPRFLADEWFTQEEQTMIAALEVALLETDVAAELARDLMALRLYDVDVRIVIDDSGSMSLPMFGYDGEPATGWTPGRIDKVFGPRAFSPDSLGIFGCCPMDPSQSRWSFAQDAVQQWEKILGLMHIQPQYYLLNRAHKATADRNEIFRHPPGGRTPLGATIRRVLQDLKYSKPCTHLILVLTDGEASDAMDFNRVLDEIQDGNHGDVQVCLMGLSLEPEDIKWFEDEECDDTRIRTIEPWEVEQEQILWRRVIQHRGRYNFTLHTIRALVTNLFPADYDYESPMQTLRHRLYITLHAIDRRLSGNRDATYTEQGVETDCFSCFAAIFNTKPGLQNQGPRTESAAEELIETEQFSYLMEALRQAKPWSLQSSERQALRHVQMAIACLQPGETASRDLKFSDDVVNDRVMRRAIKHLNRATACLQ